MFRDKKILAIIPARGGSKRLPRKNILPLAHKPLIAHTIDATKGSKYIDKVVVSSDDDEILNVAKEYGAEIFKRDSSLAQDTTKSIDVVIDVIKKLVGYDFVILLQPTSPLRDLYDIDGGIEEYFAKDATSLIGVCETEHSPLWSNTLDENLSMNDFLDDKYNNSRGQDLPTYYRINGAFYMSSIKSVMEMKTFFIKNDIYAYKMSQQHSIDIDTKLDFLVAQTILKEEKRCNI
jgi:CMP-N-acetylneuraminic acid synthetase